MKKRKNSHVGGLFEDWLKEEGIYESATNASIKKVVAWQIEQAMQEQNLTRTEMARRMATSRVQLNRLLDPKNDSVTLGTLHRAASVLGRKVLLGLVERVAQAAHSLHRTKPRVHSTAPTPAARMNLR